MPTYITPTLDSENTNSDVKSHTNEDVLYPPTYTTLKGLQDDKKGLSEDVILRPLKAIRAKCLDCCGNSKQEVRLCVAKDCPLYQYRMGCRPITYLKRLNKSYGDKI